MCSPAGAHGAPLLGCQSFPLTIVKIPHETPNPNLIDRNAFLCTFFQMLINPDVCESKWYTHTLSQNGPVITVSCAFHDVQCRGSHTSRYPFLGPFFCTRPDPTTQRLGRGSGLVEIRTSPPRKLPVGLFGPSLASDMGCSQGRVRLCPPSVRHAPGPGGAGGSCPGSHADCPSLLGSRIWWLQI